MHELSLCRGLLQQVIRIAEEHESSEIKSIHLKVGPLAGIEIELLKRAFPLVSHGTAAQHAALEITITPVIFFCDQCDKKCEVEKNQLACQQCGNPSTQLLSGDEMTLENIVLEQQESDKKHHVH